MKKTDRIARDLEQSVSTGVDSAKDWAAPRVEAAVNWAVPRLQQGLDTASPKIQEGLKSAAHNLAGGVATVTPRLQDGLAQLAPKIHDAAEGRHSAPARSPGQGSTGDRQRPRPGGRRIPAQAFGPDRLRFRGRPPHAGKRSGPRGRRRTEAWSTPVWSTLSRDRRSQQSCQRHAKTAAAQGSSHRRQQDGKREAGKPQKPKHRGLLIFGIIAAAVAAGVAAWKASKPVEDPWKVPTPVTPAPTSATTVNDARRTPPKGRVRSRGGSRFAADASAEAADATACRDTARIAKDTAAAAAAEATEATAEGRHRRQDRRAQHRSQPEQRHRQAGSSNITPAIAAAVRTRRQPPSVFRQVHCATPGRDSATVRDPSLCLRAGYSCLHPARRRCGAAPAWRAARMLNLW